VTKSQNLIDAMKTTTPKITLFTLAALAALPLAASAAAVTMTASDGIGSSSFNTAGFWNNAAAPSAGNDYFSGNFVLRTPASGSSFTFAGDSLTINNTGPYSQGFLYKGTGAAGIITVNNLILSGGRISHAQGIGDVFNLAGNLNVVTTGEIYAKQGNITILANLSGAGTLTVSQADAPTEDNRYVNLLGNNSAFTGKLAVAGRVRVVSEAGLGGNPASFAADLLTLDNANNANGGWLVVTNTFSIDDANRGITLGAAGGQIFVTNPDTNTIANLTIASPIAGGNLIKRGGGVLTLSGNNSMNGVTLRAATAGSQLNLNSVNALGVGALSIPADGNEAFLDNTSGSAVTLAATGAGQQWNRSFTFRGSSALNMVALGAVTLNAAVTATVSNSPLSVGSLSGGFAFTKAGAGNLAVEGGVLLSGNTLVNEGTLTLTGTSDVQSPGLTVASNAILNVSGFSDNGTPGLVLNLGQTLSGAGTVTGNVSDGAATGTIINPGTGAGTLTINGNLDLAGGGVLNFDLTPTPTVGSGVNDLIVVNGQLNFGNLAGATTLNLIGSTGSGVTYTLFQYTSFSGSIANITVAPGYQLTNNTATKTIDLIASHIPANLTWRGDGAGNAWDIGITANWIQSGTNQFFFNSDSVTFDNSGSNNVPVTLASDVSPSAVIVNAAQDYTFSGAGMASGSLTKSGSGTLVLDNTNTYSGATVINGGTLQLGDSAGLAGGTTFGVAGSIGTGPVTNNGNLVFSRAADMTITQPIEGSGSISNLGSSGVVTLAGSVSGSSVTMAGFGALALNASNIYSGATLVSSGTLLARNNNALGTTTAGTTVEGGATLYFDNGQPLSVEAEALTLNNGTLRRGGAQVLWWGTPVSLVTLGTLSVDGGATLNLTNTAGVSGTDIGLTLTGAGVGNLSGPISLGTGALTVSGGTWNVAAVNNYSGKTFLNGGTLVIPALTALGPVSGVTPDFVSLGGGSLGVTNDLSFTDGQRGFTANGAAGGFNVGSGATLTVANDITGSGVLTKSGAGTLLLNAAHTFAGTLNIDTAATGGTDGVVRLTTGAAIANVVGPIWVRNNNAASSTLELDGSSGGISIAQSFRVSCRNNDIAWVRSLAGNNTLVGGVEFEVGGNRSVLQADAGLLTISGALNYVGTLTGGRTYTFTGAGNILVSGVINNSANGAPIGVTKNGPGKLTLSAANNYGNTTTVNGGVLELTGSITSTNGVVVNGGALAGNGTITDNVTVQASIASGTIDALTVNGNYTINGTLAVDVNRAGFVSDHPIVSGTVSAVAGTVAVNTLGAALQVGDTFTLFSGPVSGGAALTVVGGGATWVNNLAVDGTIQVLSLVPTTPTSLTGTVNGGNLNISWPPSHQGWVLQAQTNSLAVGIATNWTDIPGTASVTSTNIAINPANPTVFFRLRSP
jgi:fibronectin-binding autotransporter adhesin